MSTTFCPSCRRPLPQETRAGVRLTALKARIFDAIKRAGIDGIATDDLNMMIFNHARSYNTVKAHIWQINELLAETNVRIRNVDWAYRIEKR